MNEAEEQVTRQMRAWAASQSGSLAEQRLLEFLILGSFTVAPRRSRKLVVGLASVVAAAAIVGSLVGIRILSPVTRPSVTASSPSALVASPHPSPTSSLAPQNSCLRTPEANFAALNFDASGTYGIAAASASQGSGTAATTPIALSDDGGSRWTSAGSVPGNVWDVAALGRNDAFVATNQGLYTTTDSGGRWSKVNSATELCQIAFWTPSDGLVAQGGRLATTSDGGRTLHVLPLDAEIDAVALDGKSHAIAAGPTGIYVTDDSGSSWTLDHPLAANGLLGDQPAIATGAGAEAAVVYNEGTLSGNEVGGLFLTSDGRTWSYAADDSFAPLTIGSAATHWLPPMLSTTIAWLAPTRVVLVVQLPDAKVASSTGLVTETCAGPMGSNPWTCHVLPAQFFGLTAAGAAAIAHPRGDVLVVASTGSGGSLLVGVSDNLGDSWKTTRFPASQ